MERKIPKKLLFALATTILLLLACLLVFIDSFRGGIYGGVFRSDPLSVEVSVNGTKLFSENENFDLPEEDQVISLKNCEKEDLQVIFFSGSHKLHQMQLAVGQEQEISLELGQSLSLVFLGESVRQAWITNAQDVLPTAQCLSDGGELFFWNEVLIPSVSLSADFRLFGDFSFDELVLKTDRSGNIVINPSRQFSGKLYVSAPTCKVYSRNFSLDTDDGAAAYYIKAKSWNGKKLDPDSFPVFNFEQLSRLSDDSLLPRLTDNATITFLKPFELNKSVSISGHANLIFEAALDFGENTLSFCDSDAGNYTVQTKIGTCPSAESLLFFAPNSNLVWETREGLGTVPALSTVQKHSNLSAYNGNPTALGGQGNATPELVFSDADNLFLKDSLSFEVRGNCLVGKLDSRVSLEDLNKGTYLLTCPNGQVRLEGSLLGGKVITQDENGKERRYCVVVEREKYNIPVLYVETENGEEITSKSQYVSATFKMDGEGTSIPGVAETHIRIRGRGNSTWKWDKKPYKIHFDEPVSLLGLPAAEEWALFANFADKSLMRNRLAQDMASKLSFSYCPTQEYVDLFLNGEYMGVYTLGEHLEQGEGRVEVQNDMSRLDCGFFLEAGGVVAGVDVKGMNYFHAGLVKFVLIKTPEYNALTSEQFDYIKEYFQAADAAVKKGEGYEEYLDMDTLIDWLIMIELTNNTDCAWRRSTYFTKQPDGKLVMGPVWDFDLAFGNFSKDVAGFNTWVSTSEDDYVGETWSTHLLENPNFQKRFKARWNEVKEILLETAMESIDRDFERLYPSAQQNFERWDILGKKVAFERHDTKNYKTYVSQIDYLKEFLINRADWMDAQMEEW